MTPARTYPARRDDVRLLVVDPRAGAFRETRTPALPDLLTPGDLLVVNDAATLPASLRGHDDAGRAIEARLIAAGDGGRFSAVLFGAGSWRQRTEDRPPPPDVAVGARLRFRDLTATVVARAPVSPRLVDLRFDGDGDAPWAALYREGRPVQYSYLAHELPLWAVQTVYAARPWAFEMPSAGRPLSWEILLALRRRGVGWAALTHAAGLSSTGDPALDAALPLPERFDIPAATAAAIASTRARGGRVVAVGTTVVRALEGAAAAAGGVLRAGAGVTDLRLGPEHRPRVVDGVLSGVHAATESHFALLAAFAGRDLLAAAAAHAEAYGFRSHELGDAMLVLPGAAEPAPAPARGRPDDVKTGMAFTHEKPIVISEAHLDSFGHLNNARYLELFEQARWDLITSRGFGIDAIQRSKTGPTVLEVNVRFLRELAPREPVVIRSELVSYERKIGKIRQQMVKADGAIACDALFTFGLFDMERRRLIEPTPEWAFAVGLEPPAAAG